MLKKFKNAVAEAIYRKCFAARVQQLVSQNLAIMTREAASQNYLNMAPAIIPEFCKQVSHLNQSAVRIDRISDNTFVVGTSFVDERGDIIADTRTYQFTDEKSVSYAAQQSAAMLEKQIVTTH